MEKLKQNSEEMKTVVETYIIEETADLIYDNEKLDKWNNLVKELKLEGQSKIVKKEKSPIPFMHLKKGLVNVFEELCPVKVHVKKFNIIPIPIEILDLIALSKRENYFHKVQIWYDDRKPDPVCIGTIYTDWRVNYEDKNIETISGLTKEEAEKKAKETNGKVDYFDWYKEQYLIGKWADVKHSFDELQKIATERFMTRKGHDYKKNIKEAQRGLDDLESEAFENFN